jgi:hypothetical protein
MCSNVCGLVTFLSDQGIHFGTCVCECVSDYAVEFGTVRCGVSWITQQAISIYCGSPSALKRPLPCASMLLWRVTKSLHLV